MRYTYFIKYQAFLYSCIAICILYFLLPYANAQVTAPSQQTTNILDEQRYTGSLLSPSGAMARAGLWWAIEPHAQMTISRGAYQADGQVKNNKHRTDNFINFTLIKYAVTNHFSVQSPPQIRYTWNGRTTACSLHFADLPVELQYRVIAGSALTINGHNTNDFIQPQFAVMMLF